MGFKLKGQRAPKDNDWKTNLYEFSESRQIEFIEVQKESNTKDIVYLSFVLTGEQKGFFSHEYRPAFIGKDSAKSVDIFAAISNDTKKQTVFWLMDVKDNMTGHNNALEFLEQLAVSIRHKRALEIYLDDHTIKQHFGYITRKIDKEKLKTYIEQQRVSEEAAKNTDFQETLAAKKRGIKRTLPNELDLKALENLIEDKFVLNGQTHPLECHLMTPVDTSTYTHTLELSC